MINGASTVGEKGGKSVHESYVTNFFGEGGKHQSRGTSKRSLYENRFVVDLPVSS